MTSETLPLATPLRLLETEILQCQQALSKQLIAALSELHKKHSSHLSHPTRKTL